MTDREKVMLAVSHCLRSNDCSICEACPYNESNDYGCRARLRDDIVALLRAQEPMGQNGEQYQCNKCKFYQGVHNVRGHAPCSFWNIGGVMWNDYCSRFSRFSDRR